MCGIAGIVSFRLSREAMVARVAAMQAALMHRGPDDAGQYSDPEFPVVLGHRRLAIIDPVHGRQPMTTPDGMLTIVFNGAIYNYETLRETLIQRGHPLSLHSDTEVLLYAYREWGEACLTHLRGMFSFAIWDSAQRQLFCARDRIGIKPFYYYYDHGQIIFASEIKAIVATGEIVTRLDHRSLRDYITFQFCVGDKTLFEGVQKLAPGHCMRVNFAGERLTVITKQYWEVDYTPDHTLTKMQWVEQLQEVLDTAIRLHLRADVPLGAHLSGGMDSSAVVASATRALGGQSLKTFTGAFARAEAFDETRYAKAVSAAYHTDYHEIYISEDRFATLLPKLMYQLDEPVAGPGVIPQYCVSQLASEHVKVVLGGQGGDEIFIGYVRYLLPYLEQALYHAIHETSPPDGIDWHAMMEALPMLQGYSGLLKTFWQSGLFDPLEARYCRLMERSAENSIFSVTRDLADHYSPRREFQTLFNRANIASPIDKMSYCDLKTSLPALLQVEDRTSMAASIESRVPLLDHHIIELMARVPAAIKFPGGALKGLFREAVRDWLPKVIIDRKDKMGFPTPLVPWAMGAGSDFVRDTLCSQAARERGIYNSARLTSWQESGGAFGRDIWGALCLELWFQAYRVAL